MGIEISILLLYEVLIKDMIGLGRSNKFKALKFKSFINHVDKLIDILKSG
jgi:hypothetical protein